MKLGCRFPVKNLVRGLVTVGLTALFIGGVTRAAAQTPVVKPVNKSNLVMQHQPVNSQINSVSDAPRSGKLGSSAAPAAAAAPAPHHMRDTTNAQRTAAAARMAARRPAGTQTTAGRARANAIVGIPGGGPTLTLDQLYFSGFYPNYANSPLPNVADTVNCHAPNYCGMRKFVDTLPLLNTPNNLGNALPLAVADTNKFPGSDYYEISLVQYRQQLHSDLPPVTGTWPNQAGGTLLRGYVQTNAPSGSLALIPSYLGPIIVAKSNRPVRVKFTNALPTGTAGKLFIPTDVTALGAGLGLANGQSRYLENRATVHLHGGNTPWISDGTPHQWTIPAGDWISTLYPRGDSVSFVPDMFFVNGTVVPQCGAAVTTKCSDAPGMTGQLNLPAGTSNDPGAGNLTFYYTNQQSGRLLFYHDHAYGTTRLNVYAGEAAGYLITDGIDADLINGTNATGVFTKAGLTPAPLIPADQIPLVIQDKTFVPQNPPSTTIYSVPVLSGGEGYTAAPTVSFSGGCTTEPTATANIGDAVDDFGQLIIGTVTDITLNTAGSGCTSDPIVSITGGGGSGAAAFASIAALSQQDPTWDTAQWGSYGNLWYPHVYMPNQWPGNPDASNINPMGRWDYASWFWPPFNSTPGLFTVRGDQPCPTAYDPTMVCPGFPTALTPAPTKEANGDVHLGQGSTVSVTPEAFMDTPLINGVAYPKLTVDPKPYRFRILSVANERTFNLSWFLACDAANSQYTPSVGAAPCPVNTTIPGVPSLTEVGMVPAVSTAGFPAWWPHDGREGGVPDPAASGPSWIQIGTEGGVLPNVSVIPPAPIAYETNMRSVTVTNMSSHGLLLMSAERADAIVDFTPYAGKTLILYNDAPAPAPAHDDRYDYYTGDEDFTGSGGAPTTLAGFGPNTRTIMQVVVNSSAAGTPLALNLTALKAAIPAAFNISQPPPVVPESTYSAAYGQTFKDVFPRLQSTSLTFTPIDPATKKLAVNATTGLPISVTLPLRMKTIQELFELDYGRMNATLGTELSLTNFNTQTTIPLAYIDPFTEDIYDSSNLAASPVGVGADGSQIWMIVHNGVDSHAIHFHLYDVQLIDRFGWDGTTRIPFPDELGWKDTVRMNPLEIDFVALRAMKQTLPFPVPDSKRLFDVTKPAGADLSMSAFDPFNNAAPQINQVQPMGWEYVWHCHLLGHEENDMMRSQVFQVAPEAPVNVLVVKTPVTGQTYSRNVMTFTDMALSEAGFNVRRATNAAMTAGITNFNAAAAAKASWGGTVTWTDQTRITATSPTYYYQVQSYKPDADYWTPLIGPLSGPNIGIPTTLPSLKSQWSGAVAASIAPLIGVSPASLTFASQAYLTTSAAQVITVSSQGGASLLLSVPVITGLNAADFGVTTSCPISPSPLVPSATCNISVTFKPTYYGTRTANLQIQWNATHTTTIPLTGTGGKVPLTITAPTQSYVWTPAGLPTLIPMITGLTNGDTVTGLSITCSTTYVAGALPGSYSTSCVSAANPNNAYTITYVSGTLTVTAATAAMISPVPGSTLTSTTVTFTWTPWPGSTGVYNLQIGSTPGTGNIFSYQGVGTSATATTIPITGGTLYVRLMTAFSTGWQWLDYIYTAPLPVPAAMLTPPPGSTLTGGAATFTWTPGVGISNYQVVIGSGVGLGNYANSRLIYTTTFGVANLPKNTTIYVRLYSGATYSTYYVDYTYVSGP